jgi:3-isopropylmalate/(R)-2-methylmalate dehydratase small subunit
MTQYVFSGRVWTITDSNHILINDIDTDQIFHNAYLHITDVEEMGQYSFDNLDGWKDFSSKASQGDIIIAGKNFGAGSSRQQAVDCFRSLGILLIIADSFGAIYKRNAINTGFPIMVFPDIGEVVANKKINNLNQVEIDLLGGKLSNLSSGEIFSLNPFSKVQKDIYDNQSLLNI